MRTIFTRRVLFLAAVSSLLFFVTMPLARATAEDHVADSLEVARAWVAQIDAGQYEVSYNSGGQALHDKVPENRWVLILNALRLHWGTVVTRKEVSHVYKSNGYEGDEGEFMVITYDTTFAKLDAVTEVVVLKWEDGRWLGVGYNAGARAAQQQTPATTDQGQGAEPQTETSTITTKTPPQ
jgi:hypothetical protein